MLEKSNSTTPPPPNHIVTVCGDPETVSFLVITALFLFLKYSSKQHLFMCSWGFSNKQ